MMYVGEVYGREARVDDVSSGVGYGLQEGLVYRYGPGDRVQGLGVVPDWATVLVAECLLETDLAGLWEAFDLVYWDDVTSVAKRR